ncbi:unnamed protein product [Diatraea saccharalis]|uniref:Uncharacterized protein n=1 Tax=Diatraea saccharalis TaxID=40085 RepID=A0A9N9N406_9NEOP|nr:unnamed protein product [Diatraea saccharalis]
MRCSQEKCILYHLKCLAVTFERLEGFSEEYKKTWTCPECGRILPKTKNSNIPLRGNIITMNKTFTLSNFVNMSVVTDTKQLNYEYHLLLVILRKFIYSMS